RREGGRAGEPAPQELLDQRRRDETAAADVYPRVELEQAARAGRHGAGGRRGCELALHQRLVVAEHRIPGSAQAGRAERALRERKQTRDTRGVEPGPVVEGIRVGGRL